MNAHERLTRNQNPAVGTNYFTPDQAFFRQTNAGGRWATDPTSHTTAPACHVKCHDDGTVDVIRLEAGVDAWQDLGGSGAPDSVAGRYC
jgi:hypothetical protein